jgi:hypothetical protein
MNISYFAELGLQVIVNLGIIAKMRILRELEFNRTRVNSKFYENKTRKIIYSFESIRNSQYNSQTHILS